jgi:hypothetical protein
MSAFSNASVMYGSRKAAHAKELKTVEASMKALQVYCNRHFVRLLGCLIGRSLHEGRRNTDSQGFGKAEFDQNSARRSQGALVREIQLVCLFSLLNKPASIERWSYLQMRQVYYYGRVSCVEWSRCSAKRVAGETISARRRCLRTRRPGRLGNNYACQSDNNRQQFAFSAGASSCVVRAKLVMPPASSASGVATGAKPVVSPLALQEAGCMSVCRSIAWANKVVTSAWYANGLVHSFGAGCVVIILGIVGGCTHPK